ncbi:universal stress protein [Bacillus sp. 1P06AnD]|uniref:universal stress protein n=1 Tax=Bacillus sp. 1P06AnD TaxID=3132208 RepID=UPI00399FC073
MNDYSNILVAIDGSEAAEKAFLKAVEIAKGHQSRLIIAHVVDPITSPGVEEYHVSIIESSKRYGQSLLEEYEKRAVEAGVKEAVSQLELGSPKSKIPKVIAEKYGADLIVCGATGMNAMERFILGSVSQSIARNAACDVLVVRS